MPFQAQTTVFAIHDINRGPHTVVKRGRAGRIVGSHPSWFETTYTVRFSSDEGVHRRVTLVGLNEGDIEPH